MYSLLEGLSRRILDMDAARLSVIPGGKDLLAITKICKENARYAQQRIQWIEEGYSWDDVEGSEQLQLEQSVLNKHKTGKVLTRHKLQLLMRQQRETFLEERKKLREKGGNKGGNQQKVRNMRLQITQMQTKLSKKRPGLFTTPPSKKRTGQRGAVKVLFCCWCKRSTDRKHLTNHHDSNDCHHKPGGKG